MTEIRFTRAQPCSCPAYGDYYIQDRAAGKDAYGNETYEYALFCRQPFRVIRRFRTRKQAYEYVSGLTGCTRWDIKIGSSNIIMNNCDYLGVLYGDTMYRLSKRTREVAVRPTKDKQLTRWHMRYVDCLAEAKNIIWEEQT